MTNSQRGTAGHRCNNSTAVGKSVGKERCSPSVCKDLVPSGSVVNTTTKKGCALAVSSADIAKKNTSSTDSSAPKRTR